MKECAKRGCSNKTTDKYCSYRCKEATAYAEQANRNNIMNNRRSGF